MSVCSTRSKVLFDMCVCLKLTTSGSSCAPIFTTPTVADRLMRRNLSVALDRSSDSVVADWFINRVAICFRVLSPRLPFTSGEMNSAASGSYGSGYCFHFTNDLHRNRRTTTSATMSSSSSSVAAAALSLAVFRQRLKTFLSSRSYQDTIIWLMCYY